MKAKKWFAIADISYLSVMTLIALFYVFANFSKVISAQLGLAQLVFSIIAIITFIFLNRTEKNGLPSVFCLLYSIAQLVPLFFWIIYRSVNFIVFPEIAASSWVFIPLHFILIIWGIILIVLKKRLLTHH